MKFKELVKELQGYDQEEEVISIYWSKSEVEINNNGVLTNAVWKKIAKQAHQYLHFDGGSTELSEVINGLAEGNLSYLCAECEKNKVDEEEDLCITCEEKTKGETK